MNLSESDLEAIMASGERLPASLVDDDLEGLPLLADPVATGAGGVVEGDEEWSDL